MVLWKIFFLGGIFRNPNAKVFDYLFLIKMVTKVAFILWNEITFDMKESLGKIEIKINEIFRNSLFPR